uniref:G-protein coupled receptors family 2 profile 1 domain-containing protein n=1 Tax=Anopheles quadriannulatus TaxID=34691 RepID=A0A182XCS4_ANOQN
MKSCLLRAKLQPKPQDKPRTAVRYQTNRDQTNYVPQKFCPSRLWTVQMTGGIISNSIKPSGQRATPIRFQMDKIQPHGSGKKRLVSVADYDELSSFPPELLGAFENSTEFECLLRAHQDAQSETPSGGCPVDFDRILCWPKTDPGTWAVLPCFEEFKGVHYDVTQNATRYCHPNGRWDNYSHYAACHHVNEPPPDIVEISSIIYYTGYILSLVALSLAVIVFVYFKDLRCLRNTIHANLFITYILSALLWIIILTLQLSSGSSTGMTSCVIFVTLLHYFTLTNFFWMLVEGE